MWQRVFRISFLILALVVLLLSIIKSTLEITLKDDRESNLRNIPVKVKDNLPKDEIVYKLPETNVLPNKPVFYLVKELRNNLWLYLAKSNIDKSRIAFLIADKKMEEVIILNDMTNDQQLIIRTTLEAINKLKLATDQLKKERSDKIESQQIYNQINKAIITYEEIIGKLKIEEGDKKVLLEKLEINF